MFFFGDCYCDVWVKVKFDFRVILLVLAVVSAITRVIGGVHFPRDVVIGFICGVICGSFLFLV